MVSIQHYVSAQITVKNPLICHDESGYLTCINTGSYIFNFSNGDFSSFTTGASDIQYSNLQKRFIIYSSEIEALADTLIIQLMERSISFRNVDTSVDITSLDEIKSIRGIFGLNYGTVDNRIKYFGWTSGKTEWRIEVDNLAGNRNWVWSIYAFDSTERLMIDYNGWKKGRLQMIGLQNDSLRYGMAISTTFRSLRKIWSLRPYYIEKVERPGWGVVITDAIVDKKYYYTYNKKGKLKKNKSTGELRACSCT